jgi:5-deoxy-glucuronate isomerase
VLLAVAEAPGSGREGVAREARFIHPNDVEVEIRGAGDATRRIHHIIKPEFPADRLEVVEVYTPAGNWSSWPPHKHDVDDMPSEAVLEEIYYYQQRRREGWGIQRLYRRDGDRRDGVWAVRHGELVLVTDGYHPFVAAHGYDAYYLNALAGDRRTMACSDDPDLAWTRTAWAQIRPDPRAATIVDD